MRLLASCCSLPFKPLAAKLSGLWPPNMIVATWLAIPVLSALGFESKLKSSLVSTNMQPLYPDHTSTCCFRGCARAVRVDVSGCLVADLTNQSATFPSSSIHGSPSFQQNRGMCRMRIVHKSCLPASAACASLLPLLPDCTLPAIFCRFCIHQCRS